jgi:hypothetical protein
MQLLEVSTLEELTPKHVTQLRRLIPVQESLVPAPQG